MWGDIDHDEKKRLIKLYVSQHMSATQIAAKIGDCTRNSIIGFAGRNSIRLNSRSAMAGRSIRRKPIEKAEADNKARVPPRTKSKPIPKAPKPEPKPEFISKPIPPQPVPEVVQSTAMVTVVGVHFSQIGYRMCRNPLWGFEKVTSAERYFCGRRTEEDSSWCDQCKPKMVVSAQRKNRRSA